MQDARAARRAPAHGAPSVIVQRTTGAEAVEEHTSLFNLDEEALGANAAERLKAGEIGFVHEVLDELGWSDRDDVVYEVLVRLEDADLDRLATGEGNALLTRMYDELTGGSLGDDEKKQSDRILGARSRGLGEAEFVSAADDEGTKIFPWKPPGLFVMEDAWVNAEQRPDGKIWVEMPVRVLGTETFDQDTATLPEAVFTSGIEIPEDEIVGVRRYDLGGEIEYRPATYLLLVANQTDTKTLETMGEVIGIGITLGSGELAALGYEASMAARVLLWADRAAFAIGLVTTALRDHRGWIISTFGEDGKEFLKWVDVTHSAVAMYGMARAVVGAYQAFQGLRQWHRAWRAAREGTEGVSGSRASDLAEIDEHIDDLLETAEDMRGARSPGAPDEHLDLDPAGGGRGRGGEEPGAPGVAHPGAKTDLDPADQAFLDATADLSARELSPSDIDRELQIAQRVGTRSEADGTITYDLPNGHSWELHPDGTMCRHSTLEHCLLFQSFPLEGHIERILSNDIGVGQKAGPLGNIRRKLRELNDQIRAGGKTLDEANAAYAELARDLERVRPGTLDEMADPAGLSARMGELEKSGAIGGVGDVTIRGMPDAGHEGPQARSYARLEGGGEFEFEGDSSQGIEGIFRPTGAAADAEVPVSLKDFSFSDNMESVIGKLNQNAAKIPSQHVGKVHLHVRVHQWGSEEMSTFIEGGPILRMSQEGTFAKMIFECSDGILVVRNGHVSAL